MNDNCPVLTPTTVTLTPLPVLVQEAYATFSATDADSGENADIHYVVSYVTERYVQLCSIKLNKSFTHICEQEALISVTMLQSDQGLHLTHSSRQGGFIFQPKCIDFFFYFSMKTYVVGTH